MLVAAGDDFAHLDIYLIDEGDREKKERLTNDGRSWLPVLSPDRRSMIYLRRLGDGFSELRTASAVDGTVDRELELPQQCDTSVSRPAWIPGTEDLVLRCEEDDVFTLVRVGLDGNLVDVLLTVGLGEDSGLLELGDPTVSGDGHTIVFYGKDGASEGTGGGALYKLDLTSDTFAKEELLPESEVAFDYSDPVFSQQEEGKEWLAWRAGEGTEEGTIKYEVLAAPFSNGRLGEQVQISDSASVAKDQDPMFSPDGESIVYGSHYYVHDSQSRLGDVQALFVASVEDPDDRRQVSAADPQFWAVPAWSGR